MVGELNSPIPHLFALMLVMLINSVNLFLVDENGKWNNIIQKSKH